MKIYFEDGVLKKEDFANRTPPDFIIDAALGVTNSVVSLDNILEIEREMGFSKSSLTLYTNFPLALNNKYCWCDLCEKPLLYLRKPNEDWRICTSMTDRELKQSNDLLRLYIGGEFF